MRKVIVFALSAFISVWVVWTVGATIWEILTPDALPDTSAIQKEQWQHHFYQSCLQTNRIFLSSESLEDICSCAATKVTSALSLEELAELDKNSSTSPNAPLVPQALEDCLR